MNEIKSDLIGATRENYESYYSRGQQMICHKKRLENDNNYSRDGSRTSVSKEEGEQGESIQGEW